MQIEAATEDEALKRKLFRQIDEVVGEVYLGHKYIIHSNNTIGVDNKSPRTRDWHALYEPDLS